ncbi:PadR family transcriptional regulator [Agrococcus sp. KRD186]|uniref:PadR family transcriptional regulator n=1 Tax=Agrococcus sp. KRD186 TaxID=2729730 RepID=UPI0019CFEC45|nr:PadR family transcriptional regulator [Agrococcus sp. KRD186]
MPRPLSRMTPATLDVLAQLLERDAPTWGLAIAGATGRPTGSVYPILERLESHEWVVSEWEADGVRPGARRRLYRLTPDARETATDALRHAHERAAAARSKTAGRAKPALGARPRPALGGAS